MPHPSASVERLGRGRLRRLSRRLDSPLLRPPRVARSQRVVRFAERDAQGHAQRGHHRVRALAFAQPACEVHPVRVPSVQRLDVHRHELEHRLASGAFHHLRRDESGSEKAPAVHDLWVDIGASNAKEVAALGLRVGHPMVYVDGPSELAHKRLIGRALDNRLGSYIIAQVMKRIAESGKKPAVTLVCLNAIKEEISGHGAMMATYRLKPDVCLCLDVTHATDTPGIEAAKFGLVKLGGGPSITHGTCNHPLIVKRLIELSEKEKIDLQHESSSRFSGTDTDNIFHSREGIPSSLVSLPLRCMHSVVETAHLDDIESTIRLLQAFVLSLKESDTFHQSLA